jgi:adenylate kinase
MACTLAGKGTSGTLAGVTPMTHSTNLLPFGRRPLQPGGRVVVTGQVGVDKTPFLQQVVGLAAEHGHEVRLCNVGEMMYAEAPDVVPGRILDLPLGRLNSLRRAVFKDILAETGRCRHVIVNTHATFRWRHGLFPAFDHDQMLQLDPDLFVNLLENVDAVHERLAREHHDVQHSLKDVLVWREEEILASEVLASIIRGWGHFFILARGQSVRRAAESFYRLMFEPHRKKVYPSFPMTHVMDMPETLAEIDEFRQILAEHFITFDPGDVDEKNMLMKAVAAQRAGQTLLQWPIGGEVLPFDVQEILSVAGDIDGQIYARDFKLIEQSDMIISYIPSGPAGRPIISSGVERELQHAHESTKEVYVIWRSASEPSPFITETATKVFTSVKEAVGFLQQAGYMGDVQMDLRDEKT